MRNQGLGSWPARRARRTPRRTALVQGGSGTELTYARLHERTTRLAHALRDRGVRRGDRVAYLGPNHHTFLETLFAAGVLGAVFVPLNTRLAAAEIDHQLRDCGAGVLVHASSHRELVENLDTGLPGTVLPVGRQYEAWLEQAAAEPVDETVTHDDPCLIMYTSGTTGRPKGAVLTHGNLVWNAVNVLVDHDLTAGERALVAAPLFHAAGLGMITLPVLLKGGTCVLAESFDPAGALEAIARHRITFMFGVPTMFDLMSRRPEWPGADLTSLRLLTCGGAPVPEPLIRTYQRRGLAFQQGYGMTEAGPGALFLDAEHATGKAGSAGVPHFFTDVRVVRPDLTETEVGEVGEIVVSGPNVSPGYWGLPEETAAALTDGWLRSGDAARADADGHITIADRIKDMYISGGENVYPAEVESALLAHPDVAECAVIGVPDEKWGEAGRALVVPRAGARPDPAELLASLTGVLARYKIPKSVVVVPELPRTASGKLLKHRIRARYGD
ncbi:long-chain fatty acid--CoA ligase [Streptomyces sp. TRM 70361]|uniref:acyl-CoA synthetase n=1 Tax=Streptomyces sp. TRM 70361 TaxID=3116553 RepID=UPI002E7B2DA8|nr:long-chain fatty acid--CoA ligase [Streptomyces sp. TRM 70361]MEE1943199.1 long-chain fatty acid--CoA ligase [Streptomyces sp. TRM 70361]